MFDSKLLRDILVEMCHVSQHCIDWNCVDAQLSYTFEPTLGCLAQKLCPDCYLIV